MLCARNSPRALPLRAPRRANMSEAAQILDAIPLPAVLIGDQDRLLAANTRAGALFGEALTGRLFITVIRQPSVLDAVETCRRSGQPQTTRYLTQDGRNDVTFLVSAAKLQTQSVAGILLCFEDTTQQMQIGQMRRDFVANVSHELRTPLTALLGFIETLQGPAREDAGARDRFLTIMAREAGRMNRLVRDLLALSQVEAQERMRPDHRVEIGALLAETARALAPVAEAGAVTIQLDLPPQDVAIPGDTDQLRQVFTNLIENAIKYGGQGGTVTITQSAPSDDLGLRGPSVQIVVADTGPGIEQQHLPRLTERFYRVDSHRSRQMGGTGLGLAIVKHIVNRHRGRLKVDSVLGQGSRFVVILPAQ